MHIGGRAHSLADIDYIGKIGLDFAEISLLDPREDRNKIYQWKRLQDKYQFYYLAHGAKEGNPFDLRSLREIFVPTMRALIDIARELEIRLLTIHFWLDRRFIQPETIRGKIEILHLLADHALQRGVTLCLENMSENSVDFARVLTKVEGLGLTLDVGHGEILSPINTSYELIENYRDCLYHVHLHDNNGGDRVEDDLHLPLGEGSIDFSSILRCLRDSGYDETLTLEIDPSHFLASKAYLQQILT